MNLVIWWQWLNTIITLIFGMAETLVVAALDSILTFITKGCMVHTVKGKEIMLRKNQSCFANLLRASLFSLIIASIRFSISFLFSSIISCSNASFGFSVQGYNFTSLYIVSIKLYHIKIWNKIFIHYIVLNCCSFYK